MGQYLVRGFPAGSCRSSEKAALGIDWQCTGRAVRDGTELSPRPSSISIVVPRVFGVGYAPNPSLNLPDLELTRSDAHVFLSDLSLLEIGG